MQTVLNPHYERVCTTQHPTRDPCRVLEPRHGLADIVERRAGVFVERPGVLDDAFTKEAFLADLHDWESAVKPAYTEHKIALGYGVYGTPKHVIDGKLVPDTESAWGAVEWADKLKSL